MSELFGDGAEFANQPSVGPESAGATDQNSRLTNSARTLALGAILSGRRRALDGIEQDVQRLGVPLTLGRPTSWNERQEALAQSDDVLRQVGAEEVFDREAARRLSLASRSTLPRYAEQRVQLWEQLRGGGYEAVPLAYAWLRLILNEDDPLLAVSGSAALSHWQRPSKVPEEQVPGVLRKARTDLATLIEDTDPLVNAIAQAATGVQSRTAARLSARPSPRSDASLPEDDASLLVHGTFAYAEDWWYPGGEFHDYIKTHVRPNLYDRGDPFLWSGRYRATDRRVAAARLADWLDAKGMMGLDCVLAHSYGGAVALQATMHGVHMDTAVLLSTPVDDYEVEWRNIRRAVSLRIHCDLVLLAARSKQRFTANVEEHWMDSWFIRHGLSHEASAWIAADWPAVLGL